MSSGKHNSRHLLMNMAEDQDIFNKRQLRVLSLPATQFIWESDIYFRAAGHGCDTRFTCFERDPDLYGRALKEMPGYLQPRTDMILGDIDRSLLAGGIEGPFDFIWLDYCGVLTKSRVQAIAALPALCSDRSIVAVTIARYRDSWLHTKARKMDASRESAALQLIAKCWSDKSFHDPWAFSYRDGRAPMSLLCFTRGEPAARRTFAHSASGRQLSYAPLPIA